MNDLIKNLDLSDVLFFDIETVSQSPSFSEIESDTLKDLWKVKTRSILRKKADEISDEQIVDTYSNRAAIHAEFGKIVCISAGILRKTEGSYQMRLKSFFGHDEKEILIEFHELLQKHFPNPKMHFMCGHNIKEFDVPYVCRRSLLHGLPLKGMLEVSGKKPWELAHLLDTMNLWSFGDYKNFTSLKLLTHLFGVPTPKDDMDGSEVGPAYWQQDGLDRISTYCQKDVVAVAQLFLKYRGENLIPDENIFFV